MTRNLKTKLLIVAATAAVALGASAGTAGAIPVGASGTVHSTPCKWWC